MGVNSINEEDRFHSGSMVIDQTQRFWCAADKLTHAYGDVREFWKYKVTFIISLKSEFYFLFLHKNSPLDGIPMY